MYLNHIHVNMKFDMSLARYFSINRFMYDFLINVLSLSCSTNEGCMHLVKQYVEVDLTTIHI